MSAGADASTGAAPVVCLENVRFSWPKAPAPVLDIPRFEVAAGERVFLRGASGSGKSTLLSLVCGVLVASAGAVRVLGEDLTRLKGAARDRIRADDLGVIFQLFNLVPYLSVIENVTLPVRFSAARRGRLDGSPGEEARRLLAALGLDDARLIDRQVIDLSVGQQQRVAAARALIASPALVIADEPTSALDAATRDRFIALLSDQVHRTGASLLFVSHDAALAPLFDRAVDLDAINRASAEALA